MRIGRRVLGGLVLAGISSVLFGTAFTVAGRIFDFLSPVEAIGVRMVVAGVVCVPFVARHRFRFGSDLGVVALLGVMMGALNLFVYWSVERIGVGPAAGIQFLGPALVVVWKRLWNGVRYPPVMWLAVGAGVTGAGFLARAWVFTEIDVIGIAFALGSGLMLATYLVLAEDLGRRHSGVDLATAMLVIGGVVSLPLISTGLVAAIPADGWWLVASLGSLGLALPLLIEVSALRSAPSEKVGLVLTLEPFAAAVSAWIVLSQALHPLQVLGMVLVVTAVVVSSRLRPTRE